MSEKDPDERVQFGSHWGDWSVPIIAVFFLIAFLAFLSTDFLAGLEKTDQVGGTSAWSVGMMWFVDSGPMQNAGFKDSFDKARKYFAATVGTSVDRTLQEAYISQGRVALDYMLKHSGMSTAEITNFKATDPSDTDQRVLQTRSTGRV